MKFDERRTLYVCHCQDAKVPPASKARGFIDYGVHGYEDLVDGFGSMKAATERASHCRWSFMLESIA